MSTKSFELVDQYGIVQKYKLRTGEKPENVIVETYSQENNDDIIEDNKRQQAEAKQTLGKGTQTSMYKLGQLSHLQTFMLMNQGVFFDDKALRGWFNDLDNYLWRTVNKKRRGGQRAV